MKGLSGVLVFGLAIIIGSFLFVQKAQATVIPDWAKGRNYEMAENQVKAWTDSPIRLYYEGFNWYFGESEIEKWVTWIDRGNSIWVELDRAKVYPSLDQIAWGLSRPGYVLDKDAAVDGILLTLRQLSDRQVSLQMTPNPPGTPSDIQLNRFPGMYIDINLSNQTLSVLYWERVLIRSRVSTGRIGYDTPLGVRNVRWHGPRVYSTKYKLWMPYWLDMGEGYGIHELPEWGNGAKEGASHLGIKVSHGCVRLGVGPAEQIYNLVPDGAYVYIHQ